MVRNLASLTACTLILSSCNVDLKGLIIPTSDVVEKRFEQSMELNNDASIDIVDVEDDYMFYVCTDPHINETTTNLSTFFDRLCNDGSSSFGVILGDCIDIRDNLPAYLDAMSYTPEKHRYDYKVFHILGNHDIFFNGWIDFKELIGPSVYWFETRFSSGKDLYIALDSASGTLGQKQTRWLQSFLSERRSDYRHCFILTHTNFFYPDNTQKGSGNFNLDESMALVDLLGKHNTTLVLQGHDHYREDLVFNNVRYTVVGTIRDECEAPEYLRVNVNEEGIILEWELLP